MKIPLKELVLTLGVSVWSENLSANNDNLNSNEITIAQEKIKEKINSNIIDVEIIIWKNNNNYLSTELENKKENIISFFKIFWATGFLTFLSFLWYREHKKTNFEKDKRNLLIEIFELRQIIEKEKSKYKDWFSFPKFNAINSRIDDISDISQENIWYIKKELNEIYKSIPALEDDYLALIENYKEKKFYLYSSLNELNEILDFLKNNKFKYTPISLNLNYLNKINDYETLLNVFNNFIKELNLLKGELKLYESLPMEIIKRKEIYKNYLQNNFEFWDSQELLNNKSCDINIKLELSKMNNIIQRLEIIETQKMWIENIEELLRIFDEKSLNLSKNIQELAWN